MYNDNVHYIVFQGLIFKREFVVPDHMDNESTRYSDGYLVEIEYDSITMEILSFDRSFGGYP